MLYLDEGSLYIYSCATLCPAWEPSRAFMWGFELWSLHVNDLALGRLACLVIDPGAQAVTNACRLQGGHNGGNYLRAKLKLVFLRGWRSGLLRGRCDDSANKASAGH
jgi:hypothetical protein